MAYAIRESLDCAILGAWWIATKKSRVANVQGGDSIGEDAEREQEVEPMLADVESGDS